MDATILNINQFGDYNMFKYFIAEIEHIFKQTNESDDCKIRFTNSKKFNAKVKFEGNLKIIEINIGVIMIIYHLSFITMMNDLFFSNLDGGKPLDQMDLLDFELPKIETHKGNVKEIKFYTGPNNPKRIAIAKVIGMLGVEFVIFHELGHILGGHLDYIKNNLKFNELLMQGSEYDFEKRTNDIITYQTLEMDADAIAIDLLIENTFCKKDLIIDVFLEGYNVDFSKILMLSLVISFFLIGREKNNKLFLSKYLPRDYRFHLVSSKLLSKLKKEYALLIDRTGSIENVIEEYIKCNDFLSFLYKSQRINEIPSKEFDNYYSETILNKWKNIRTDVQTYASIILPE